MAITSFIDPFGSMVQGYKEGQQTELQRQAGQRAMRDSDYEYGQRQIRDPLANRLLSTNVDQALFNYLTSQQQNPIQTKMMQEQLSGLGRQAEFERATQPARIEAARMDPMLQRSVLEARQADVERTRASIPLIGEQIRGARIGNDFNEFISGGITQDPNKLYWSLVGRGQDPRIAAMTTSSFFPDWNQQSIDPLSTPTQAAPAQQQQSAPSARNLQGLSF